MDECFIRVPDGAKAVMCCDKTVRESNTERYLNVGYAEEDIFYIPLGTNRKAKWLYLPDTVEWVDSMCFEGCFELRTVYLSANLSGMLRNAFADCKIEDLYYPGSIFEYEKVQSGPSRRPVLHRLHCKDGCFDFSQEKYISVFPFDGTRTQWIAEHGDHWLNRRAEVILCRDGVLDGVSARPEG